MSRPKPLPSLDENEKAIVDYVYKHMLDVAFGESIYTCDFFCKALREEILPKMMETIKLRAQGDLNIKIATDIGMKSIGDKVDRLKKEDEKRICLEASFIMLIISRPDSSACLIKSKEEMLAKYPEFGSSTDNELRTLISFRNVMVIAMQSITPRYNKNRLLTIVTRIVEGRTKRYVTGSGQTECTSKRVLIYERESGIIPVSRPRCSSGRDSDEDVIEEYDYESLMKHRKRVNAKKNRNSTAAVANDLADEEAEVETPPKRTCVTRKRRNSSLGIESVEEDMETIQLPVIAGEDPHDRSTTSKNGNATRNASNQSTSSNPDVEFFKTPFVDLYSGEDAINAIQLDCFANGGDFFDPETFSFKAGRAGSSPSKAGIESSDDTPSLADTAALTDTASSANNTASSTDTASSQDVESSTSIASPGLSCAIASPLGVSTSDSSDSDGMCILAAAAAENHRLATESNTVAAANNGSATGNSGPKLPGHAKVPRHNLLVNNNGRW